MKLPIYQVDAFCKEIFSGNPAAVCPLDEWLPDALMQNIALENNLAETAFFVPLENHFHIRWFTPGTEVKLCGHATLASAHILYSQLGFGSEKIVFDSLSGLLEVSRRAEGYTLDFPADKTNVSELPSGLFKNKGINYGKVLKGDTDYMLVLENESQINELEPDMEAIRKIKGRGLIVTAPGDTVDFVCRFFAPQSGVDEDPATGSAQTTLTPFWANRLGKNTLASIQLSARKGYFNSELVGERVKISGKAITYMAGEIEI